jgi:hypothetical protein
MAGSDGTTLDGVVDLGPGSGLHHDRLSGKVVSVGTEPDDRRTREALLLGMHAAAMDALLGELRVRGLSDEQTLTVLRRRIEILRAAEATLNYRTFEATGALQTRQIAVPALATQVALLRDTVIPRLEAEVEEARAARRAEP